VITHNPSGNSSPTSGVAPARTSAEEQRATIRRLRHELLLRYRPVLQQGAGPIRVMARMVAELEKRCRELQLSEEIIESEIVNRTIGDVDLRRVVECEGEPGGPRDYRMLADELGIALPGENLNGYTASGAVYLRLREQMLEYERALLERKLDLRIYDIVGIGNPLLRSWLATEWQEQWGITVSGEQVYLSLGAMDGIDKTLRGLRQMYDEQGIADKAVLFPAPGFGVPEAQARAYNYRLHRVHTRPEHRFKLTADELEEALQSAPDLRIIYLTVTNNPTTFAFTPAELNAIHAVVRRYREAGRQLFILADLAYVGTGNPREDRERMATFADPAHLAHTIFVSSFSKTLSLTGDRFGWVTIGDPCLAPALAPGWSNSMASLPAEWQLRFMAYVRFIRENPHLLEKVRDLYRLRRRRFIAQLQQLDRQLQLFEEVYLDDDATVYNWSKLRAGEDAFSLFEKTGIAGVPGSGFGYSDEYVRFSIGVIPVPPLAVAEGE
jgi:aspartate/methionine/tyrosine aminotransferase